MKLITTAKGYWESLNTHRVDTGVINLSNLDKTLLNKAEDLLDRIGDLMGEINKYTAAQKDWSEVSLDKMREMWGDIMDLSSKFYELIPEQNY